VDREGLGVYDRLEQGVCIAWALFGNEFSIVVVWNNTATCFDQNDYISSRFAIRYSVIVTLLDLD